MRQQFYTRRRGITLAETAASIALLLPLFVGVLLVASEASRACVLKHAMSQAARQASRDLAMCYGRDPSIVGNRARQNTKVYDKIRITNAVNASAQFDTAVFDTASDPPTVSVTVHYASGQYGLPTFPNPDPLNLGSSFQISASATYRLQ